MLETRDTGGVPQARYVYGHTLVSQEQQGSRSYYYADGIGSIRVLTNETAVPTDTYTYDAFGRLLAATGETDNPYRFAGEAWEPLQRVSYHRARYYQPTLGRFLSMDPAPGAPASPVTLHKYLYAGADPINRVDPSGQTFFSAGDILAAHALRLTLADTQINAGFAFLDQVRYGGSAGLESLLTGLATGVTILALGSILRRGYLPSLPSGRPGTVIREALEPAEYAQAQRIVEFRGGIFQGAPRRSYPGIDGWLDGNPVSLKKYTGTSPQGVLRHASRAEEQVRAAGEIGAEVFIEARGVKAKALLDFMQKGAEMGRGGLSQIPHQGSISAINVETTDG